MAVDKNFEEQVLEVLQKYANALENESGYPRGATLITTAAQMTKSISVPGVLYNDNPLTNENAVAQAYVQIPWAVMADVLEHMTAATEAVESIVEGAENVNATLDEETAVLTVTDREGTETSVDTAAAAKEAKSEWDQTYKPDIVAKSTAAERATLNAETATAAAERVNAQLNGMTVSVTNRNGVTTSVNIGFEITEDHVYPTKSAMLADAENVQAGKFCMIATIDPTSPDNAQLWSRNSSPATSDHPFTFLSDLDQASSSAWADWLNSMKPQIESKISQAETDHGIAESDHTRAEQDHTTASGDHTTAQNDHTTAESDHTRAEQDHTTASGDHTSGDHTTAESDHTTASGDHTRADADHELVVADRIRSEQDHSRAEADHRTAESDHTTADSDHTAATTQTTLMEAWNTHLPFVGDGITGDANYWYTYDPATERYVKGPYAKGDNLDWDSMSEQEKQALANAVLAAIGFDDAPTPGSERAVKSGSLYNEFLKKQDVLIFATAETCESLVEELT